MTTTYVNDITTETKIVAEDCIVCGVTFGLGAEFQKARRRDHRGWFCPNGHEMVYNGETEEEKLRRRLEQKEADIQWLNTDRTRLRDNLQATERSKNAYKGQVTRIKRRVEKGVCPAPGCQRSFVNVKRHIASQHPDFAKPEDHG